MYQWFFNRLKIGPSVADATVQTLSDEESAALKTLETKVTWAAAMIGALGVVVLFVPRYLFPQWFLEIPLDLFGFAFTLPWVFVLWSALLVLSEIVILTLMHLYCIHKMAVITGFLTEQNRFDVSLKTLLIKLGREQKDTSIQRFGINPLEGLNRSALLLFNLFIAFKASLSNMLFKFVIQRMLGRYAFQWIQDMAGVPVFAVWNAFGTRHILNQGRIVIMGQNLVREVTARITAVSPSVSPHESLVFQTLKLVAISKRDYHFNHFVLVKNLVEQYRLKPVEGLFEMDSYFEALRQAPASVRELCALLTVLGFLLDGKLSGREKKRFVELKEKHLVNFEWTEIEAWNRQFVDGKGLDSLLKRFGA